MKRMSTRIVQEYALVALLIGAGLAVFFILKPFLAPLALAAIFAVVLQPVYRRARKEVRGSETFAALTTVIMLLLALLIPIMWFGSALVQETQQLSGGLFAGDWQAKLAALVQAKAASIDALVPGTSGWLIAASANLDLYAREALTWLVQHIGVAFSSVSAFVLALFVFFLALYYLLRDGARLCRYIVRLSPLADTDDEVILARLTVAVNSVVRGKLLIALVQGIFAGIGLALFGVPNALLWALVATVAALVPPLGIGLVMVPAALYVFIAGSSGGAIGLLVWGFVAGVLDNVLGPKLMAHGTAQHPLLTLLSILGGIALFGPVGVFLGPLVVSLFLTLLSLHINSAYPI